MPMATCINSKKSLFMSFIFFIHIVKILQDMKDLHIYTQYIREPKLFLQESIRKAFQSDYTNPRLLSEQYANTTHYEAFQDSFRLLVSLGSLIYAISAIRVQH